MTILICITSREHRKSHTTEPEIANTLDEIAFPLVEERTASGFGWAHMDARQIGRLSPHGCAANA